MSENGDAALPSVREARPEASTGSPETLTVPEPGTYYRLTREYDEDMASESDDADAPILANEGDADDEHAAEALDSDDPDDPGADFDDAPADRELHDVEAGDEPAVDEVELEDGGPKAGTVLLVTQVNFVDGEFHSATTSEHPGGKFDQTDWTADEFRRYFEPAPDWKSVRARELVEAQDAVAKAEERMARGPSREEVDPEPGVHLSALPTGTPTSFAMAVRHGSRDAIESAANRRMQIATRTGAWFQAAAHEFTKRVQILAEFQSEAAHAKIAATQRIREEVSRLTKGIESLGIYSGDGVAVEQVADGASATRDIPLVLFQRLLFMDEEFAINLALGGPDWEDLEAFHEALRSDDQLRRALVPYARCVVLFQVRRKEKDYYPHLRDEEPLAWAMMNAEANASNRKRFLLVRDGERISHVWLPDAIGNPKRLFPKMDELDKPFRGYDGTKLTFEDLAYHKAHEQAESEALFYRRILVLLWGLNDRLSIFGDFYDPATYPMAGFLSIEFQHERMLFVHDDDMLALQDDRPRWDSWIPKMNAHLQPGSRVLCWWRKAMTHKSAPTVVKRRESSRSEHDQFTAEPVEAFGIATCIMDREGRPTVKVPVTAWRERKFEASVNLALADGFAGRGWNGQYTPSFLVLDAVRAEDVEAVIRSRGDREHYLTYLPLLMRARNAVMSENALTDAARLGLSTDILAGHIATTAEDAELLALESVRMWRAAHGGHAPPDPGTAAGRTALKQLRATAWASARGSVDADVAAALASANGRTPLALVARGDGRYSLYAVPRADERHDDIIPWRWSVRVNLAWTKSGGLTLDGEWKAAVLPLASASERVIYEWPEAATRRASPFTFTIMGGGGDASVTRDPNLSLGHATALAARLREGGDLLRKWADGDLDVDRVLAGTAKLIQQRGGWTPKIEGAPDLLIPIAVVEVRNPYQKPDERFYFALNELDRQFKREEDLKRARERAAERGHHVLAVKWSPYAALLRLGGKKAAAVRRFWADQGYSRFGDGYEGKEPILMRVPLIAAPADNLGIVREAPYHSGEIYGAEHLDGAEYAFDVCGFGYKQPGFRGRVTYVSPLAADLVRDLIGSVRVKRR